MHRNTLRAAPMNTLSLPSFAHREGERLQPADRDRVWAHLMGLSAIDRQSRFGYAISDEGMARWLNTWDWETGMMWHPHGPNDPIVALVQLAPLQEEKWEMAFSVSPCARGLGWAHRLRDHGLALAQSLTPGGQVVLQGSAWNRALVRVCQGAHVQIQQGDLLAVFDLPMKEKAALMVAPPRGSLPCLIQPMIASPARSTV